MTCCLTLPFSRTEATMRTYSWTVPLEEGILMGQSDHERFGPERFDLLSSSHLNQDDSHDQQRQ